MPVSDKHYDCVRAFFKKKLLGGVCRKCGTVFNLEFHHPKPLITKKGRGRDNRMWEWFEAFSDENLELYCHECHVELHKEGSDKDE